MPEHTAGRTDASGAAVSLPVLDGGGGRPSRGKPHSAMGKRRTLVLVALHVAILAHVAHWLIAGETVSPVEPSESMYTLNEGELNAGFVFFAVALLATLIFGRFVCGWGCHVVALQDGSLWLLKKMGLRPSPFRSRLLLWFPLGLALYMFVWPTFERYVAAPALEAVWPAGVAFLGGTPAWAHLENAFVVEDFWATFPSLWVAIPFVFAIGFAAVYFLGAKGFCTYACPYGGFFAPLEQVSPMRIVVDHDKCAECGVCTAVCTSNVRVSEEIKDHGMVVSPGCMKCLDCVSACPSGALAYRATTPPVFGSNPRDPDPATAKRRKKKPRTPASKVKWDLTWPQEIALAVFFLVTFVSVRGIYGVVPMLFAGAIAAIATWLAWKAWRSLTEPNVRLHGLQLRRRGRYSRWGVAYLAGVAVMVAGVAHSAVVSWHWSAGMLELTRATLARQEAAPDEAAASALAARVRAHNRRAADHLERANAIGLASTPKIDFQLGMLHAELGEPDLAEAALRRVIARERMRDDFAVGLAELLRRQGRVEEATALLEEVVEAYPRFSGARAALGADRLSAGRAEEAVEIFLAGVREAPELAAGHARLAEAQRRAGRPGEAAESLARAAELAAGPEKSSYLAGRATALFAAGRGQEAIDAMVAAAESAEGAPRADLLRSAAQMASRLGDSSRAMTLIVRADEARRAVDAGEPGKDQ